MGRLRADATELDRPCRRVPPGRTGAGPGGAGGRHVDRRTLPAPRSPLRAGPPPVHPMSCRVGLDVGRPPGGGPRTRHAARRRPHRRARDTDALRPTRRLTSADHRGLEADRGQETAGVVGVDVVAHDRQDEEVLGARRQRDEDPVVPIGLLQLVEERFLPADARGLSLGELCAVGTEQTLDAGAELGQTGYRIGVRVLQQGEGRGSRVGFGPHHQELVDGLGVDLGLAAGRTDARLGRDRRGDRPSLGDPDPEEPAEEDRLVVEPERRRIGFGARDVADRAVEGIVPGVLLGRGRRLGRGRGRGRVRPRRVVVIPTAGGEQETDGGQEDQREAQGSGSHAESGPSLR